MKGVKDQKPVQSIKSEIWKLLISGLILLTSIYPSALYAEECDLSGLVNNAKGTKSIMQGYFTSSMEHSGFTSCETADETWWADASEHFDLLSKELTKLGAFEHDSVPTKKLFVRVALCVSKPGNYGHMRQYPRHVEFLEIITYRAPTEDDCLSAAGS